MSEELSGIKYDVNIFHDELAKASDVIVVLAVTARLNAKTAQGTIAEFSQ